MYRNNDINEYLPENAERKLVKQPVHPRGRGANAIFFQGGVRTKDRFFSPGTDFAARANYILLRSYRINSNAVIFQFLLF